MNRPGPNHIAAIHTLKTRLRMTDEDYRAVLMRQAGKNSCKDMTQAELARVREYLQQQALHAGVASPRWQRTDQQPRYVKGASPLERKVRALWGELGRAGKLDNPSPEALQAWVKRQTGCDHLRWCRPDQMHGLIESMKLWLGR